MYENTKKTGEIISSVTQNRTCELPQFLHDFDDYAIMYIEKFHHSLTVRNFVECTINKKITTFLYNLWIIGTHDFENSQIALA